MTNRKNSDNLSALKQYRGLIEAIETALSDLLNPEISHEEEVDFPYDVYIEESGKTIVVEVEIPGISVDCIKVNGFDKFIEIRGMKDTLRSSRYESCVCLERQNGNFRKVIYLGNAVNFKNSSVSLCDGILVLKFPIVEDKRGVIEILTDRGNNG
jgi:HSP20 family molecular chaperone IbpA